MSIEQQSNYMGQWQWLHWIQRIVRSLKVVNDAAERGVAMIQAFNGVTNQEEQKQFILQVVE